MNTTILTNPCISPRRALDDLKFHLRELTVKIQTNKTDLPVLDTVESDLETLSDDLDILVETVDEILEKKADDAFSKEAFAVKCEIDRKEMYDRLDQVYILCKSTTMQQTLREARMAITRQSGGCSNIPGRGWRIGGEGE